MKHDKRSLPLHINPSFEFSPSDLRAERDSSGHYAANAHIQTPLSYRMTNREIRLIRTAQDTDIAILDPRLKSRPLKNWITRNIFDYKKGKWESNDCGEQTGNPQNTPKEFPICVVPEKQMFRAGNDLGEQTCRLCGGARSQMRTVLRVQNTNNTEKIRDFAFFEASKITYTLITSELWSNLLSS